MANTRPRVGKNPRAYEGVRAINPPEFVKKKRDPRTGIGAGNPLDFEFDIGTIWLNESNFNLWMLVDKQIANNKVKNATWVQINSTLVGDITEIRDNMGLIVVPDGGGAVDIVGDLSAGIFTTRTGPNTLTISSTTGNPFLQTLTTDGAVVVSGDPATKNINVFGGNQINTVGSTHTVTINLDNSITLGALTPITPGDDALTVTTGDITIESGNFQMPRTDASLDIGVFVVDDIPFINTFRDAGVTPPESGNWFIGYEAGSVVTTVASLNNIGLGNNSLVSLTAGAFNIAIGDSSQRDNQSGNGNLSIGSLSLSSLTTGSANISIGSDNLSAITTSNVNISIGNSALQICTTAENNVIIGHDAAPNIGDSIHNILIGDQTCEAMINGQALTVLGFQAFLFASQSSKTIVIGHQAGTLYTGTNDSNIVIGHPGIAGSESNTIRIGDHGNGLGQQDRCFIAGIRDATITGTTLRDVIIDENNQLSAAPEGFAFLAYRNTGVTGATGAGATYVTQWDANLYNFGGAWNGTNTFTAPIDCIVELFATIRMSNLTAAMTRVLIRLLVPSQLDWIMNGGSPGAMRDPVNAVAFHFKHEILLDAGDTVQLQIQVQNGAGNTADFGAPNVAGTVKSTWFGGRLMDSL